MPAYAATAAASLPYPVLAHQGGWDEILFVVAPMAVFGGLLWMANKRADKQLNAKDSGNAKDTGKANNTAKAKDTAAQD